MPVLKTRQIERHCAQRLQQARVAMVQPALSRAAAVAATFAD
jgi:hypothetical protein